MTAKPAKAWFGREHMLVHSRGQGPAWPMPGCLGHGPAPTVKKANARVPRPRHGPAPPQQQDISRSTGHAGPTPSQPGHGLAGCRHSPLYTSSSEWLNINRGCLWTSDTRLPQTFWPKKSWVWTQLIIASGSGSNQVHTQITMYWVICIIY